MPQKGVEVAAFNTRRWSVGGILVGLALLSWPAGSALASSSPAPDITVGPLTASHGFKLTIVANCNGHPDFATVSVIKSARHYSLGHYYEDTQRHASRCTAGRRLGSGSLILHWGRLVNAELSFGQAGKVRKIRQKGCPSPGRYRRLTGTGTLQIAIHTKAFGTLEFSHVPAEFQRYDGSSCGGGQPGPVNTVTLSTTYRHGRRSLDAFRSPRGKRSLYVFAPDDPARHVSGSLDDIFYGGAGLFSFDSNLTSARVGSVSRFLSGSLEYRGSGCSSQTTGKLTGKLVLHDPASGLMRFTGGAAEAPTLSRGDGTCP